MVAIKKDAFLDMGSKFRDWRHSVKKPLKIKDDDTPETVRARMTPDFIGRHDPLDIDVLLEKWCTKKNKVNDNGVKFNFFDFLVLIFLIFYFLFIYFVVSLITSVLYLTRFLF